MKYIACVATWLLTANIGYASIVTPIQADYGNVFPTLTEQNIDVFRTTDPAPWYVSFNLLANADVKLGVQALPPGTGNSVFNPTAIRLVTLDGDNVQFGTDTFSVNPFPDPITQLVVADNLPVGHYALEVSGSGNRFFVDTFGVTHDSTDFTTRLQVAAVPVPAAIWLFGTTLFGLLGIGKRVRCNRH